MKFSKANALARRIIIMILCMIIVSTAAIGVFSYVIYRGDQISLFADKAVAVAYSLAAFIDPDEFFLAIETNNKNEYYLNLQSQFDKAKRDTGALFLFAGIADPQVGLTCFMEALLPGESYTADLNAVVPPVVFPPEFFNAQRQGRAYPTGVIPTGVNDAFVIAAYAPIFDRASRPIGVVGININVTDVFTHSHNFALRMLFIVALTSAVLIWVPVFYIRQSVTKPILKVAENFKDIAQGDGDLTRVIAAKGNDEISMMSRYFNQTIEKIKTMIYNIREEAADLTLVGSDLASDMAETAASMNQITANIQSVKQRIIFQSTSVTETNAAMEQISANINMLNGHVELQTSSVAQSSSAIEEMLANIQSVTQTLVKNVENVRKLTEASDVGRTGLQEVSGDIKEIAKESEGLLEINAVMENISSQTNLLSMNAAIEAAHAGDLGRGFAVVAAEIRKLAESSSAQSKTISTVLKKIKSSIDKITKSTENVLEKFGAIDLGVKTVAEQEGNIRNAMEEQGHGSKQVLEAISRVNETTQLVRGVSLEMLERAKKVMQEAGSLGKSTQEITGGINEMSSGVVEVNKAISNINELTNRNRETAGKLMSEVQKFKID
jgi:methyl-accepting chemotaxis protein